MSANSNSNHNAIQVTHTTKLLATVELMEFAVALQRQNLIRFFPNATPLVINEKLQQWIEKTEGHYTISEID